MFCINCGVKLADTEKKCPLCDTVVYHPSLQQKAVRPLYPENRHPKIQANSRAVNGFLIFLFFIPMLICFWADLKRNGALDWFGFAAGGLLVVYIALALPLWFRRPNPVIFLPCNFATLTAYLLYVDLATEGAWFLSFAFPIMGALCLILCTMVTLIYYLRKGRLYIFGGGFIALGALMLLVEFLLDITFDVAFIGWAIYPLVVFVLLGGALIYLGINRSAREIMERKLFF